MRLNFSAFALDEKQNKNRKAINEFDRRYSKELKQLNIPTEAEKEAFVKKMQKMLVAAK